MRALLFAAMLSSSACCVTVPLSIAGEFAKARECAETYELNIVAWTHYPVHVDARTPKGIAVDRSGRDVDLVRIDTLIDELERDIRPWLQRGISRCGFVVKVADDAVDAFPCPGGGMCRGVVQPPNVLVVDQNLWALKHEAIHLVFRVSTHEHPAFRFQ